MKVLDPSTPCRGWSADCACSSCSIASAACLPERKWPARSQSRGRPLSGWHTPSSDCGFLERNGDHYRIGAAVLRLGFESIASLDLSDLGRPAVDRLCEESGFPSQLVIRDEREAVVVLKSSPPTALVSNVVVGTRFPAHATILGRVLLSDADDATLAALYPERTLPRLSPRTPRTLADRADYRLGRTAGCPTGDLAKARAFYNLRQFDAAIEAARTRPAEDARHGGRGDGPARAPGSSAIESAPIRTTCPRRVWRSARFVCPTSTRGTTSTS